MLSLHKSQSLLVLQEQGSCHWEALASLTQKTEKRVPSEKKKTEGGDVEICANFTALSLFVTAALGAPLHLRYFGGGQ